MSPSATSGPEPRRRPPWTTWEVGQRVVVRRRLAEGGFTDVLGELVRCAPDALVVRTRRGEVLVPTEEIALGKLVPPAPAPRRPRGT
ncbi:hypothetical protein [Actinotalea sp. C106]|uniref:putative acetyltransferase n=1 Tax=Actinotalea sp. C106 TaxID=2908644 RepID=UPI0020278816|nr:hypothetical protein [Actinotalea sp. C106]